MKALYTTSKGKKIPLLGIPDGLGLLSPKLLADYKTGKKEWDKKRADDTGQLTFYLLLLFLLEQRKPTDFELRIHWIPTRRLENGDIGLVENIDDNIRTILTKRTMVDISKFCKRIEKTVEAMQDYVNSRNA